MKNIFLGIIWMLSTLWIGNLLHEFVYGEIASWVKGPLFFTELAICVVGGIYIITKDLMN